MELKKWYKSDLFPTVSSAFEPFFNFDSPWDKFNFEMNNPAVNITDTDKEFMMEVAAPGMKKSDFDIEVDNHVLTISSEEESSTETKEENYTRKEFSYSSFRRSFTLPENVLEDKIKATYKDGILKVHIPKTKMTVKSAKTIEVG
ncbi:MAG: Hsp20/alpha crystallin family protein [Bacteroidia bacterium]|nr:Hsp20/alpha crystallin family protein [Bacteroidia bacterium]